MQHAQTSQERYPAPRSPAAPPAVPSPEATALMLGRYSNTPGLRDYLTTIFKHKVKILITFFVLSLLATAGVVVYLKFLYTPLFEARSLVLVKSGWENRRPELSLDPERVATVRESDIVSSEVRILQSRDLKERVVNTVKVENIYPALVKNPLPGITPMEAAVLFLEKSLLVTPAKNSSVIEVAFKNENPAAAATVVNNLVNLYIDKRTEIYRDPKSIMFLDKKTEEYRQKLADSENKLKVFKDQSEIISFDDQRTALLTQRATLNGSINTTATQIQEVQERMAELEKQMQATPKIQQGGAATERRAEAESRLFNMQLQEKELLSKFKEDNRLVVNLREQMQLVKQHMETQAGRDAANRTSSADPVYQDLQKQAFQSKAELSTLKVRKTALDQELTDLNKQLDNLVTHESKYRELQREVTNNEERYRSYRQRLDESRIYDELERQKMTSVSVIEPASVPMIPANPQKPTILFVGIVLLVGMGGALGMGFLLEFLKRGVTTPAEAERRLGLPVLVAVPYKS